AGLPHGQAVGDDRVAAGRGHVEGEQRLVGGVVVAGEHQVRGVGLVRHDEPVGGAHPAAVARAGGHGVTGVVDGDTDGGVRRERAAGREDQVLTGGREVHGGAVDVDGVDLAVGEVQVQVVESLGGDRVDGGGRGERLGVAARVGEVEVVRRHVVAGVAQR